MDLALLYSAFHNTMCAVKLSYGALFPNILSIVGTLRSQDSNSQSSWNGPKEYLTHISKGCWKYFLEKFFGRRCETALNGTDKILSNPVVGRPPPPSPESSLGQYKGNQTRIIKEDSSIHLVNGLQAPTSWCLRVGPIRFSWLSDPIRVAGKSAALVLTSCVRKNFPAYISQAYFCPSAFQVAGQPKIEQRKKLMARSLKL